MDFVLHLATKIAGNELSWAQVAAAAFACAVTFFWFLDVVNFSASKLNYEWINSKWLPRLLWPKPAHVYAEEGYRKVGFSRRRYFPHEA